MMSDLDYMNAIAGAVNAGELATSTITQQWKATPLKAASDGPLLVLIDKLFYSGPYWGRV